MDFCPIYRRQHFLLPADLPSRCSLRRFPAVLLRRRIDYGNFCIRDFSNAGLICWIFPFAHTRYAQLFFKTAGVVVIGFGLLSLFASLAGLGIIKPLFNF